jgi:hypothetical protein
MHERICVEWREVWWNGSSGDMGEVHLLSGDLTCGALLFMERSIWETRYYRLNVSSRHQEIIDFAVTCASHMARRSGAQDLILDIRLPQNIGIVLDQRLRVTVTRPATIPVAA